MKSGQSTYAKFVRKGMFLLIVLLLGMFLTVACSKKTEVKNVESSPVAQDDAAQSSATQSDPIQSEDSSDFDEENKENKENKENEMKINIQIGDSNFVAALDENETAKSFFAMLPLSLDMEDVNGNEKYSVLPESIRKEASTNPKNIYAGDIKCYGDGGLVVFYDSFSTSYNYVSIGHIDDIAGLTDAMGSGDLTITFSAR